MVGQGTKDPADREFEALLAGRVSTDYEVLPETEPADNGNVRSALSNEMFESLMGELGGLGRSTTDKSDAGLSRADATGSSQPKKPGTPTIPTLPSSSTPSRMVRFLDQIQPLRNRLAEITRQYAGDKSLRQFQADSDLLAINLQISGLTSRTDRYVFVEAASQQFSLSLDEVIEVVPAPPRREYINDEWVLPCSGQRYPAFSLHDWWISKNKQQTSDVEFPVFVLIGHDNPVALLIDRCIGVSLSRVQPLGRLLSGSIGLKGISDCKDFGSALVIDVPALGAMLRKRSDDTGSPAGI